MISGILTVVKIDHPPIIFRKFYAFYAVSYTRIFCRAMPTNKEKQEAQDQEISPARMEYMVSSALEDISIFSMIRAR